MLSTVRKYHWRKWPHFYAIVFTYWLAVVWRGGVRGWKPCRAKWREMNFVERVQAVDKAARYLRVFGLPLGGVAGTRERYAVRAGWTVQNSVDGT